MYFSSVMAKLTLGRLALIVPLLVGTGVGGYHGVRYVWAQYHFHQGKKEFDHQQYARARAHLNLGLEVCSRDLDARILAARASRLLGDFEQAEHYLDACKGMDDPDGRLKLAVELLKAQNSEHFFAREPDLLKRVEEDDPDSDAI